MERQESEIDCSLTKIVGSFSKLNVVLDKLIFPLYAEHVLSSQFGYAPDISALIAFETTAIHID